MPPPITTTSKRWPAIASIAAARESISRGSRSSARPAGARAAPSPGAGGRGGGGRRSARSSGRPTARAALGASAAGPACASSRRGRGRGRRAGRCRRRRRSRAGPPRPGPGRRRAAQETTIRVGARSSFAAPSGPAASFSRASAAGPTTRKRQGAVRWWLGAQRASSSSSRISSRAERLGAEGLVRAAGPDRGLDVHAWNIAARLDRLEYMPCDRTTRTRPTTRRSDGRATRAGRGRGPWRRGRCRSGARATGLDPEALTGWDCGAGAGCAASGSLPAGHGAAFRDGDAGTAASWPAAARWARRCCRSSERRTGGGTDSKPGGGLVPPARGQRRGFRRATRWSASAGAAAVRSAASRRRRRPAPGRSPRPGSGRWIAE